MYCAATSHHLGIVAWIFAPLVLHWKQIDVAFFRTIKPMGAGASQARLDFL